MLIKLHAYYNLAYNSHGSHKQLTAIRIENIVIQNQFYLLIVYLKLVSYLADEEESGDVGVDGEDPNLWIQMPQHLGHKTIRDTHCGTVVPG